VFTEGNVAVHSGDTFSLGMHTITASATDTAGNTASETFTITVQDTTPPVLTPIASQTDQATGPNGAVATFAATATDLVDGTDQVVFKEGNTVVHSGDTFSLGAHTITASATDAAGNSSSEQFTISVVNSEPRPPPPSTTAIMIMHNPNTGDYEIYNVGNNQIRAAYWLGEVGSPWTFAALGTLQAGDVSDMLLRNTSTGAFEAYYVSGNNIVGATLAGTVGTNWNFAGIGNFDGASSLSELMLRNANSGSFELYHVAGGGVLSGSPVAPVGNNFQVKGFGFFSDNSTTQMLMQDRAGDAANGQLELYTYQPSTALLAGINVGKVGSNLSIVGCADLLGNGQTQMVMQQDNGNFWLYTYSASTNSFSGQLVGAIGSNFHVVGFGSLGTAGQDEMLMQDAGGNFEVYQYNASLNAFVGSSMGAVGAPWVLDGIAAASHSGAGAADTSNAQLVQAMAGFGGGSGAGESLNAAPLGADTSQQTFLTTPQHA
jgi:HYR domain